MDSKIWTDQEILDILLALDNVYLSKSTWIRWMYKPWHDALQTVAMLLCKDLVLSNSDKLQAVDFVEDLLN